jgi:hypothetical protein
MFHSPRSAKPVDDQYETAIGLGAVCSCFKDLSDYFPSKEISLQGRASLGTLKTLNDLGLDSHHIHIAHGALERHGKLSLEPNRFVANHT